MQEQQQRRPLSQIQIQQLRLRWARQAELFKMPNLDHLFVDADRREK